MTAKEKEDAINELTAYIHCLKCDRSGKVCDDNCPTQYEAGNCGEIIKNLEFLLEEVKKMPTLFKSVYNLLANYEPLEPCDDAISRQAVLNLTKELRFNSVKGMEDYCYRCIDPDEVEELPPITPTSSKMEQVEWISVKDRMPKDGEWVLCQLDDEFYDENTMMVLYHTDDWGEKWVDGGLGTGSYDVCAWMPLPNPYVKEDEE